MIQLRRAVLKVLDSYTRGPEFLLAIGCAMFAWYTVTLLVEGAAVRGLSAMLGMFLMAGGVALHRRIRMSTDDQRGVSAQSAVDARQRNIEREVDAAIEAARRPT